MEIMDRILSSMKMIPEDEDIELERRKKQRMKDSLKTPRQRKESRCLGRAEQRQKMTRRVLC